MDLSKIQIEASYLDVPYHLPCALTRATLVSVRFKGETPEGIKDVTFDDVTLPGVGYWMVLVRRFIGTTYNEFGTKLGDKGDLSVDFMRVA